MFDIIYRCAILKAPFVLRDVESVTCKAREIARWKKKPRVSFVLAEVIFKYRMENYWQARIGRNWNHGRGLVVVLSSVNPPGNQFQSDKSSDIDRDGGGCAHSRDNKYYEMIIIGRACERARYHLCRACVYTYIYIIYNIHMYLRILVATHRYSLAATATFRVGDRLPGS